MVHAIELLLDDQSEERVVACWRRLGDAGLASQTDHRGESNRPHVTLTTTVHLAEGTLERLAALLGDRLPVPARLGGLLVLGSHDGRRPLVLARQVVMSHALLDLHTEIAELTRPEPGSHGAPGRWTPHVTLARRMPADQLPAALAAVAADDPEEVTLVAARHWDSEARRAAVLTPG